MRNSCFALVSIVLGLGCAHQGSPATAATTTRPALAEGETTPCGDAQVFFAAGSAELDASARERLDVYAGCLLRHETDVIYVAGNTAPEGTQDANLTLGRRRAFAVAERLHTQGVSVDFVIRTYGEEGAAVQQPLWPLERSAEVTAVATP